MVLFQKIVPYIFPKGNFYSVPVLVLLSVISFQDSWVVAEQFYSPSRDQPGVSHTLGYSSSL